MKKFHFSSYAGVLLMLSSAVPAAAQVEMFAFPQQGGEVIYKNVCQDCHMPDGRGAVGAGIYPALTRNPRLKTAAYPISVVIHGLRAMPAFGSGFTDQQIADVVNYVRTHFGNRYGDKVTPGDVKVAR